MGSDPDSFVLASASLRADKDVAMLAVKHNGNLLEFCSEELRAAKEVVWRVVRTATHSVHARAPLGDEALVLSVVEKKGLADARVEAMRSNKSADGCGGI